MDSYDVLWFFTVFYVDLFFPFGFHWFPFLLLTDSFSHRPIKREAQPIQVQWRSGHRVGFRALASLTFGSTLPINKGKQPKKNDFKKKKAT